MPSLFSRIIARELPAYIVAEDEQHIAFLDINPNALGHTLCVPKKEVDKLFDLSASEYQELMMFSRSVAAALKQVVSCKRIGLTVIGLEVPHVHVHLIPLNVMADATFKKKVAPSKEEMQTLTQQISAVFKQEVIVSQSRYPILNC
jgi:histidine triad (HIT) family protein